MARFLHHHFRHFTRKWNTIFLALCYVTGLLSGILFFNHADCSIALMRSMLHKSVSIVHLLIVIVLPFLLSAFAVYISRPRLLYFLAFAKAFSFAFVSVGICVAFRSGAWLLRGLLMFSDIAVMTLLLVYWFRHISGTRQFRTGEMMILILAACCIGVLDYHIVSPFLAVL